MAETRIPQLLVALGYATSPRLLRIKKPNEDFADFVLEVEVRHVFRKN